MNVMKKTYHLCLSAGNEVMFRDLEDYHRGFNSFALALYKSNSLGLVEAIMSTHLHLLVQTEDIKELMYNFRNPYSKYFNHKYQREGRLGEKHHFTMDVVGFNHILAAASYILRNPLHHGVAPIPYAYPHCSASAIFSKEMGHSQSISTLPRKSYYRFLGRHYECPETYELSNEGVFLRKSVLDIPQVENLFGTPRAFNFFMNRRSSEEWEKEQQKDCNNYPPVNIHSIEKGITLQSPERMLVLENGKADYKKISDIDLCTEVDRIAYDRYAKHSVYQLSDNEKRIIAKEISAKYHISNSQICRCLALDI